MAKSANKDAPDGPAESVTTVGSIDLGPLAGIAGAAAYGDIAIQSDPEVPASEAPVSDAIVLKFDELLPDSEGEVVVLAGEDVPVNLMTSERIADTGIVEEHVTAGGFDVQGLHFYSFENGVTLYSPTDILIFDDSGAV